MSEAIQASAAPSPAANLSETANTSMEASESEAGHASEAAVDADPSLSKAEKAEAKRRLKSLKIKFNGREVEEELPFEIEDDPEAIEYMTKHLQMSKLGQTKAQEYSQLEKEVRGFIEELKKNPRKILMDPTIGVDIKKLAAEVIEEEIENSQKSPEQLEKEKLERELKAIKEEREKEREELRAREFERLQEQEFERYDMLMTQALEKHKDLPKSPYVVKKMADYMLLGLNQGIDVTPEDVIPLVKEEMHNDLKEMFSVMPEEVIEALIGKETINKLRKRSLAKAKSAPPTPVKALADTGKKTEANKEDGKKMTYSEFFKGI